MAAKLLIADDSTTIQKVFERTFSAEEFALSFVTNGEEALARARAERPNVIIADINMPVKNGFELCEELKRDPALRGIPVLLLIGILDDFDEDESRRVGADGFIVKPFEANAAITKVREVLAKGGSAPPLEGPAGGQTEEVVALTEVVEGPTTPPSPEQGTEEVMELTDLVSEPPAAPTPPPQEQAEEITELTEILEGSSTPQSPEQGPEEIFEFPDIAEKPPAAPTPPPQEQAEEITELTEILEGSSTPQSPEQGPEEIFEFPDIAEKPPAAPTPPPQKEGKEEGAFRLETPLRELEEELKAEFPEEQAKDTEGSFLQEEPGGLELDLPFEEGELESQEKDAEWTSLFGELGIEETDQEAKNERLGNILDESTSELEKIEGFARRKEEEAAKEELGFVKKEAEFAEKFMDDFEPVFEQEADRPPIGIHEEGTKMTAEKDTEEIAAKVVSAVNRKLKEVVEETLKDKVPQLVRQEMERLKKE
jgi:CheY-like chemotaxis protein